MASLCIEKIDAATGTPISGVIYLLQKSGGQLTRHFTNAEGKAIFFLRPNCFYTLYEAHTPRLYLADKSRYELSVCKNNSILLDNWPIQQLILVGYKKTEA